ncbi:Presenilin-domain-containing protein [Zychaea mexicana]|uniref:Presenilin-domain-containing protein n=1 Tax=Zychaea mexicana TaxID=64656 RepID=UPI0022FE4772|nr:Presenilin-domain-containing protein [Zychaea mexicana]KAI9488093.1 Presenilin-domain-containing protein [Zychaea mexicana]
MSRSSLTLQNGDESIVDDEATVAATTTAASTTIDTAEADPLTLNEQQQQQRQSPLQQEPVICTLCQKSATFMCSSCGLNGPRYCSMECQKTDWKESHYKVCEATLAARRSRRATGLANANAAEGEQRTSRLNAALAVNSRRNTAGSQEQDGDGNTDIAMADLGTSQDIDENNQRRRLREDDEEFADELKFYMQQIYFIIKPVVACIILSIFWVKVAYSGGSDYSPTRSSYVILPSDDSTSTSNGDDSSGDGGGSGITQSLTNAFIIIGQIIVVTVVIVFLFRKGWIKVLVGFFMIVVLMLLGFMTYLLLLNLIQVFSIPMDYITMVFALWNFAVVGLVSIFWKGPLWLQQGYLTVMSSLMAFSLTGLEEWTTWILLGLLAVWDLIAVLCPFGPLRLLIESSRKQQREVPALLYSVNAVWFMLAATDHVRLSKNIIPFSSSSHKDNNNNNNDTSSLNEKTAAAQQQQQKQQVDDLAANGRKRTVTLSSITDTIHSLTSSSEYEASTSSTAPLHPNAAAPGRQRQQQQPSSSTLASSTGPASMTNLQPNGFMRLRAESISSTTVAAQSNTEEAANKATHTDDSSRRTSTGQPDDDEPRRRSSNDTQGIENDSEERDEEDVERSGLKLGLGDFVFYSVLIARAALYDWITTVCCTIAVLTGLTTTIFLLAIYKKALPALPISIAFGILFYFVAKTVLVPYIGVLCVFGMVGL